MNGNILPASAFSFAIEKNRFEINRIRMYFSKILALGIGMLFSFASFCQIEKRQIAARHITALIKIDGLLNETEWANTTAADKFTILRPTPFEPENKANQSQVYFLYNNDGLYIGGYFHEKNKDSIAAELVGRDGFGNNDFVGIVFDTYQDKQNGFEYFVTPLGEQFDAKVAPNMNGNNEDFSWNAVWQSAAKIHADGWSFEMFIPYAAIRFGNKKVQDWGLNIIRSRQKSGEQLFWQSIDPNANGFLTQEGTLTGLKNIQPPLRLQLSPYLSTYQNHDGNATANTAKNTTSINGGMDIKYGINQAFTIDMTLIPDFGQVQTDNRILNLSPFEQKFSENRTFFTEGADLFSKGNLFYSRRIGRIDEGPLHYYQLGEVGSLYNSNEYVKSNPKQVNLINASKLSGRTQKGLGVGILNAVTKAQFGRVENKTLGVERTIETDPLTNYNVVVLDQTLKNNSSISLVNTNVWRSGKDYDANVTAALFDFNDKKNKWNIGGNVSSSSLFGINNKPITGYAHSLYFGKTSGQFNFQVWQDLSNATYNKRDLGYYTNNNTMDQGIWASYNWTKPTKWYNQLRISANGYYSRLVSPIDVLKRSSMMYQNAGLNINVRAQTKKLWWVGANINGGPNKNDFYEPRLAGRVFRDKGRFNINTFWNSNEAKKISWGGALSSGLGGVFNRTKFDYNLFGKIRFNSKFSVEQMINVSNVWNQSGYAALLNDTVIFSRRNVITTENVLNIKYNFTNKMGLSLRARHYWSKVAPLQFYELDKYGDLQKPTNPFTKNVQQNYNFLSVDMVYTWQFAQGSFVNIVWKNIAEDFSRQFEKNYTKNFSNTIEGPQFNSLSLRVIYFLDYLTIKNRLKPKKGTV